MQDRHIEAAVCEVTVRLDGQDPRGDLKLGGYLFHESGEKRVSVVVIVDESPGVITFRSLRISNPLFGCVIDPLVVNQTGTLSGAVLVRLPTDNTHINSILADVEKQGETPGMGVGSMAMPQWEIVLVDPIVK